MLRSRTQSAESARVAVAAVFGVSGFVLSSWATRLPAVRDKVDVSTEQLGLLLLFMSVGSVIMLPLAGAVVSQLGTARTVTASATLSMAGVAALGLAPTRAVLAVALTLTGASMASWDVAMNVEGAQVERSLGRSIMSRFHAAFSLGTVAGAGVGALAALIGLPIEVHLSLVAVLVWAVVMSAVRWFPIVEPAVALTVPTLTTPSAGITVGPADLSDSPAGSPSQRRVAMTRQLHAWAEPATLMIGVLVLSMALAEGAANDWLALSLVDGYGAVHAVGALGLAVFVTGMTATRMAGPAILRRFDHVAVIRVSAGFVLTGTLLLVLGANLADGRASTWEFGLAAVAALLWGFGAALGFPMGMSAASADPAHAATRVAVVSTIGYGAFLAGPPLLGALAQRIGTAQSMIAISIAVLIAFFSAGAIRPPAPATRVQARISSRG